jgi:hypothetical protein
LGSIAVELHLVETPLELLERELDARAQRLRRAFSAASDDSSESFHGEKLAGKALDAVFVALSPRPRRPCFRMLSHLGPCAEPRVAQLRRLGLGFLELRGNTGAGSAAAAPRGALGCSDVFRHVGMAVRCRGGLVWFLVGTHS